MRLHVLLFLSQPRQLCFNLSYILRLLATFCLKRWFYYLSRGKSLKKFQKKKNPTCSICIQSSQNHAPRVPYFTNPITPYYTLNFQLNSDFCPHCSSCKTQCFASTTLFTFFSLPTISYMNPTYLSPPYPPRPSTNARPTKNFSGSA